MARILPDRDVKKLLSCCIIGGLESQLNPNGIELRLGKHIRFLSTGEEREIPEGHFVKIAPGENVIISSLEKIDFSKEATAKVFPGKMVMAFITPTTTMMREGITQSATKIDPGFVGQLNWGLRNSSIKDLVLQNGESIFKLTFWLLDPDEVPDSCYGSKPGDQYQNTDGIKLSSRKIPADIPQSRLVASSTDKLDGKKQLKEAGYPFNFISSELVQLHGKFEMVSKDVLLLKDDIDKRTNDLSDKIGHETSQVFSKLDETRANLLTETSNLLTQKFVWVGGVLISAVLLSFGALNYLRQQEISAGSILVICIGVSFSCLAIVWGITRKP